MFFLWCLFPFPGVNAQTPGCTDSLAINFDPSATTNDGSCIYSPATISPVSTFSLPVTLVETSGLIFWNDALWTHNDDTDCHIYELDTTNGNIVNSHLLSSVVNIDWEEISQDSSYVYIGDFGNNLNGNRTNLKILRISKSSILLGSPIVDTISFSYSNQIDFSPTGANNTDFDCEAMIVAQDSIYLFTKQYVSHETSVYSVSKSPGTHLANYKYSYNVGGLITGATYLPESRLIVLSGYSSFIQPFIYCLYNYDSSGFFSGNKRKIDISLPFHQVEGITTNNGLKYYISNEDFTQPPFIANPQKLHILDLNSYLGSYMDGITAIKTPGEFNMLPDIYPNPAGEFIHASISSKKYTGDYELMDEIGKIVKRGILTFGDNVIQTSDIPSGIYYLQLANGFSKIIYLIK